LIDDREQMLAAQLDGFGHPTLLGIKSRAEPQTRAKEAAYEAG